MAEEHALLHVQGIRAAGRLPTEYRRSTYAGLAPELHAIRSAWSEFDDGRHFLLAGNWLMSGSPRDLLVSQQSEPCVQEVAWELATAWGQLVRKESLLPAFEREIEVHVRIPPKKTVSATAIVVGRSKAQPNPILDM